MADIQQDPPERQSVDIDGDVMEPLVLPKEYDYTICIPSKDDFISILTKVKKNNNEKSLKLYVVEEIDLNIYAKKENEKQTHYPNVVPKIIDPI